VCNFGGQEGRSNGNSSAWPVANPVLTCATPTEAGYPSNFVADPFLYVEVSAAAFSAAALPRGGILLCFRSKKNSTVCGCSNGLQIS